MKNNDIDTYLSEKMLSEQKYTEIIRLHIMLERAGIPHEIREFCGGYQITYPEFDKRTCSVIEHNFSYGRNENLLEIQGLLTDEEAENDNVLGFLNAVEVFGKIADDWEERQDRTMQKHPDMDKGEER